MKQRVILFLRFIPKRWRHSISFDLSLVETLVHRIPFSSFGEEFILKAFWLTSKRTIRIRKSRCVQTATKEGKNKIYKRFNLIWLDCVIENAISSIVGYVSLYIFQCIWIESIAVSIMVLVFFFCFTSSRSLFLVQFSMLYDRFLFGLEFVRQFSLRLALAKTDSLCW